MSEDTALQKQLGAILNDAQRRLEEAQQAAFRAKQALAQAERDAEEARRALSACDEAYAKVFVS